MDYADNKAWSRRRSKPVDISGLIAESEALYGLEMLTPPPPKQTAPPPPAPRVIRATSTESREPSLRTIQF